MNTNDSVSCFLRELANRVDNNTLTDNQFQQIGEFLMAFLFQEQDESAEKGGDEQEDKKEDKKEDKQDFMKFIVMGWYVYSQLLKK